MIRKDDLLIINFPTSIITNKVQLLKYRDMIRSQIDGQHFIMVPTTEEYWIINWADHTSPAQIIKIFKEEFPWINITDEGIVL